MKYYAISDRRLMGPDFVDAVRNIYASFPPQTVAVQIREKDLSGRELYAQAAACAEFAPPGTLFINSRADIARGLGIGLHLPERGLPIADARRFLGPQVKLGASRHTGQDARAALEAGADFVTLSPIRGALKHERATLAPHGFGLDGFQEELEPFSDRQRRQVFALGGLEMGDLEAIQAMGARGIAGIRMFWQMNEKAATRSASHAPT